MALKPEIVNENFDYFFLHQAAKLSEEQRKRLPTELLSKIYRKGYRINSKSTSKLNFAEKLLVLKYLGKKWVLLVEDETNGMAVEDFFKYKELTEKRNYGESNSNGLLDNGVFALASDELMETNDRINRLSVSAAYNYVVKVKTKNYLKPDEYKAGMNFLCRFLTHYESNRKKMMMETGLNMAEWLTLIYLYDGEEKVLSVLYKEKYRHSYNSSATKIRLSFCSLQEKGLIVRHGVKASSKFQITAMGKQKVSQLAAKYVVNC